MSPFMLLAVGFAGGLGAACRFVLDGVIQSFLDRPIDSLVDRQQRRERGRQTSRQTTPSHDLVLFPWPTIIINLTGSLALGLIVGFAAHTAPFDVLPAGWEIVLGTGFLGGYTTFSTASVDAIRLAQVGRWGAATTLAFGVLLFGTVAAACGMWLGGLGA